MSVSIGGTAGVTFNDASVQNTAATGFGFKNRIINGAMTISQRGTTFSILSGVPKYTLDRQYADSASGAGAVYSVAQSTDAPTGFTNSLLVTTTTATATAAGDYAYLRQMVEGYNWADSAYGSASAKTFTLSFWVKSSLTGTFGIYLGSQTNFRFQTLSYTIPVANTWTYITIPFSGDTLVSSTNWNNGNGVGLQFAWTLSCGTNYQVAPGSWTSSLGLGVPGNVNVTSTSGATFYITGVQLEKGSTATSFDYRPFGTELMLCQRYCEIGDVNVIAAYVVATVVVGSTSFKVTKRATPTLTYSGTPAVYVASTAPAASGATTDGTPTVDIFNPRATSASSTAGYAARLYNYQFLATAEL